MADQAVAAWAKPGSEQSDDATWRARLSSTRLSSTRPSPTQLALTHPAPTLFRHALGGLMAVATAIVLSWGLGRPALWLDEGATVLATERSWPNLWHLFHGGDAPLIPYYVVLKLLTSTTTHFFPQAAAHPEVLYRWPSVAAMVIALWVFTVWLGRFCPPPVVLAIGVVALATGGISRYGQEARPYPFIVLFAVLSTVLWTRLVLERHWRYIPLYALALILLVTSNTLTATLVFAHLVACVVAVERGRRWFALRRTMIGAVLAAVLAAPLVLNAALHGDGASYFATLTPLHLSMAFIRLFTMDKHPFWLISAVLVLSVIGLAQVFLPGMTFLARLAACWALVPPAALLPAVYLKRNLLIGRYLLFSVPGWIILGGLGVATLAQLVYWAILRLTRQSPAGVNLAAVLSAVVAVAVLAGLVVSQTSTLQTVRGPGGKSEDIRPALAEANLPQYASMPIYVTSIKGTVEITPYGRQDESRLIGRQQQRDLRYIWPAVPQPADFRTELLNTTSPIVVLVRGSANVSCPSTLRPTPEYVERCLPWVFHSLHYRATTVVPGGTLWNFAVVTRVIPAKRPATPAKRPATSAKPLASKHRAAVH